MRHFPNTDTFSRGLTTHCTNFQVIPQPFPPIQIPPHCNKHITLLSLGTNSIGVVIGFSQGNSN